MNAAAVEVMKELPDLCLAYGVSDEYRYIAPLPAAEAWGCTNPLLLVSHSTPAAYYSSGEARELHHSIPSSAGSSKAHHLLLDD